MLVFLKKHFSVLSFKTILQQSPLWEPMLNSKCKDPKSQNELRIGFIWHEKVNKWICDLPS